LVAENPEHLVELGVMIVVALVPSTLPRPSPRNVFLLLQLLDLVAENPDHLVELGVMLVVAPVPSSLP
jgi:hypothetical protein